MTLTPYDIRIAPTALRQINALASRQQKLILKLADALAVNPRPPGASKIEGMTGLYSEEIENLALIYKIEDQEILLLIVQSGSADHA